VFSGRREFLLRFLLSTLVCPFLLPVPRLRADDLKLVIRPRGGPEEHPFIFTLYEKGPRARWEFRLSSGLGSKPGGPGTYFYGHRAALIYQCDRRRVYGLDLDAHEYTVFESNAGQVAGGSKSPPVLPSGATVQVTIESRDTGERKKIFGIPARHIVTRAQVVAEPGACTHSEQVDRDGWYADLDFPASCFHLPFRPEPVGVLIERTECNGKRDKVEIHRSGIAEAGFPLELMTTSKTVVTMPGRPPQPSTFTRSWDVIELSEAPLDPGLFELPAGFQRVQELHLNPVVPLSVWLRFRLRFQWERFKLFLRSIL
jgi:hypothetical protein